MSSILPVTTGLVVELHPGGDGPSSIVNHAPGAVAVPALTGAPTYGSGYIDLNGNGATPKGVDTGYQALADDLTFMALVDPNVAVSIATSSGLNAQLAAIGRLIFDAPGAAGDTFSINGQAVTLRAAGAAGFEINIGATRAASAAAAAALINANPATFGVTAFCPAGNSVIDLMAIAVGTGGNAIALAKTGTAIRMTSGGYSNTASMSGGTAGETVVTGLDHSGTNYRYRNSSLGTGGVPTIPVPATAGYHFIVGRAGLRDFPELILITDGVIAARAVGTTAGRAMRAAANVCAALTGGGTGNGKLGFLGIVERIVGDDELVADYLATRLLGESKGLPVN